MTNFVYPNGVGVLNVNGRHIQIDEDLCVELSLSGVDFGEFRKRRARGMNKVFAMCRITSPDGSEEIVVNMKEFVAAHFTESYGWVMNELKKPLGYKGYRSERLFFVSVSQNAKCGFSAIPLLHPDEFPVVGR